jgi:hypothetical protein
VKEFIPTNTLFPVFGGAYPEKSKQGAELRDHYTPIQKTHMDRK